jgi:lactoylglutathione lyase
MKKILYTMIRVTDLQRSIAFYSTVLGMNLLSTFDDPKEKFTLTFMGYGKGNDSSTIELTYNYGVTQYDQGEGYGHIAIQVENCIQECEFIKSKGGNVIVTPRLMAGLNETIAFIEDPDGYKIELIEIHKV